MVIPCQVWQHSSIGSPRVCRPWQIAISTPASYQPLGAGSRLAEARTVLAAVKTTAYGGGRRPVLTAAARGAVRCMWPGQKNGSATEQRNTLKEYPLGTP